MDYNARLEEQIAEVVRRSEHHDVDMAMLNARTDALHRLSEVERQRIRRDLVAASPAASRRVEELEREETRRIARPCRRAVAVVGKQQRRVR